jgi:hypothetical protein
MYNVVYLTLGGGKFLGQMLTALLEKKDKTFFDLYDNNDKKWTDREEDFHYHKNLKVVCSWEYTFDQCKDLKNLIFINTQSQYSQKLIAHRNKYIPTSMIDYKIYDVRSKYHFEMYRFLKTNHVNFFDFDFENLSQPETFYKSIKDLCEFFGIDYEENLVKYGFGKWQQSNKMHTYKYFSG